MFLDKLLHFAIWGPTLMLSGSGPSKQEQDAAAKQSQAETAFYNQLEQQMQSQYSGQQAILDNLKSIYQPIINQGINQYGLGAGEDSALRTQATEGTAGAYSEAAQALGDRMAAADSTGLPSGAADQLKADLANRAAQANAADQLGITQKGFDLGRQNFLNATGVLSGVGSMMNPLGYAGAVNQGGNTANSGLDQWDKATSQSLWGSVLGALGGIGGDLLTGGMSSMGGPITSLPSTPRDLSALPGFPG